MNLDAYSLSLIAGGFTTVGALIGCLTGYWFSRLLADRISRNAAASNLRASFAPYLFSIRAGSGRTAGQPLADLIKDLRLHETEMEKFRAFVCRNDLADYEKACREYVDIVTTRHDAIDKAPDPHLFLKERINAVLIFAKP